MAESSFAIPLRSGANMAPLKPLLSLQETQPKSHYICDALRERWNHYWKLEQSTWNEMIRVGKFTGQIMQGDQLIIPNPWTNGWLVIKPPREDDSTERALNMMQFYVSNCLAKELLSNPDVVVKPGRDTDESELQSKGAGIIVDHYEERFFDPWFVTQESLLKYCFGTAITRLRHDTGIKGAVALREITENREITLGDGAGWCGDCGLLGRAADFIGQVDTGEGMAEAEMCPGCGSGAVMVNRPPTAQIPTVVGQEQIQLGDLVLDSLPFPLCRWDLYVRPEESSWFCYQRDVALGAIKRMLGNVRLPGGTENHDLGKDVAKALAYSGLSLDGKGKRHHQRYANRETAALCEMWLSPDDVADITIKGDEETIASANGEAEKLPVGASLADLFPDGLVAVGANGMQTIFGLYPEKPSKRIASSVWHAKPMSGAGRGLQDVVEVQKRLNKLDSQQLDYMDSVATPATLAVKGAIDDDQGGYLGKPRANIMVELSKIPQGMKLADMVSFMPAQSTPGTLVQYVQQFLTQAFATTSHQTDFSNGGLVDQRNDTARGAAIADANAKSVLAPMLAMKALHRKRIAQQVVEYYPECFPIERYFPLGGKNGKQLGTYISGINLQDADLIFEVTPESELPQNSETKINRTVAFFQLFGGIPLYIQAKQAMPSMVSHLERLWNIQIDEDSDYDNTAQLGRRILDQMQSAVQLGQQGMMSRFDLSMGQVPLSAADPMVIIAAIQPPPSIIWPDLPGLVKYFQNWAVGEGLDAPPELIMAVELLTQQLFQMGGMQQAAIASQAGQAQAAGNPEPDGDEAQEGPPEQ